MATRSGWDGKHVTATKPAEAATPAHFSLPRSAQESVRPNAFQASGKVAVLRSRRHGRRLLEAQLGEVLLAASTERLSLLRRFDFGQPDFEVFLANCRLTASCERVAICDGYDYADECDGGYGHDRSLTDRKTGPIASSSWTRTRTPSGVPSHADASARCRRSSFLSTGACMPPTSIPA